MPIGCLICDEPLDSPAPVPAPDPFVPEVCAPAKPKKSRGGTKKPPPTPSDNVVTPCGHMFHEICLNQWFKSKNSATCPVCRKALTKAKLNRVFPSLVDAFVEPTPNSCSTTQCGTSVGTNIPPSVSKVYNTLGSPSGNPVASINGTPNGGDPEPLTGVIKWAANGKWSYHSGLEPYKAFSNSGPTPTNSMSMASVMQSNANQCTSSSIFSNQPMQYGPVLSTDNMNSLANTHSYSKPYSYSGVPYQSLMGSSANLNTNAQQTSSFSSYNQTDQIHSRPATTAQIAPYTPILPNYLPPLNAQSTSTPITSTSKHLGNTQSVGMLNASSGPSSASYSAPRSTTMGSYVSTSSGSVTSNSSTLSSSSHPPRPQSIAVSASSSATKQNHVAFSGEVIHLGSHHSKHTPVMPLTIGQTSHNPPPFGSFGSERRGTHETFVNNKYDELNVIHQTLVADYNELQQKYNDSQDEVQLLKAQLESSKDEIKRLQCSTKVAMASHSSHGIGQPIRIHHAVLAGTRMSVPPKRSHDGVPINPGPSTSTIPVAPVTNALNTTPRSNTPTSSTPAPQSWPFFNPYLAGTLGADARTSPFRLPDPQSVAPAAVLHNSRPPTPVLN